MGQSEVERNEIMELEKGAQAVAVKDAGAFATLASFEAAQRMAGLLCKSTIIPKAYQNNIPNTVVALNMARRLDADPLMVMQNLYIVYGNPAWNTKFLIASVNASKRFTTLTFEMNGEVGTAKRSCVCVATDVATGQRLEGTPVSVAMADAEGWSKRDGSKWKTMPELMLRYRAAAFWVRLYAPEIAMGLRTEDEVRDIEMREVTATQVDTGFAETPPPPTSALPAPEKASVKRSGQAKKRPSPAPEEAAETTPTAAEENKDTGDRLSHDYTQIRTAAGSDHDYKLLVASVVSHYGVGKLEELPENEINGLVKAISNPKEMVLRIIETLKTAAGKVLGDQRVRDLIDCQRLRTSSGQLEDCSMEMLLTAVNNIIAEKRMQEDSGKEND